MREPVILIYCDACWQDGQQRVPATQEFAAGAIVGAVRPTIKRLDLCEVHAKTVTDLMLVLEHAVQLTVSKEPVAPKSETRAEIAKRQHRSLSDQPVDCPVFDCDMVLSNRSSLVGHIWTQHRLQARPKGVTECPDCGFTSHASQVGMHRVSNHGYDPIDDALTGLTVVRRRG